MTCCSLKHVMLFRIGSVIQLQTTSLEASVYDMLCVTIWQPILKSKLLVDKRYVRTASPVYSRLIKIWSIDQTK